MSAIAVGSAGVHQEGRRRSVAWLVAYLLAGGVGATMADFGIRAGRRLDRPTTPATAARSVPLVAEPNADADRAAPSDGVVRATDGPATDPAPPRHPGVAVAPSVPDVAPDPPDGGDARMPPELTDGAAITRGPRQAYDSQWQWASAWSEGGRRHAANVRGAAGARGLPDVFVRQMRAALARAQRVRARTGGHPAMQVEFQVFGIPSRQTREGWAYCHCTVGADFAAPASPEASADWYAHRQGLELDEGQRGQVLERLRAHEVSRRRLDVRLAERLVAALRAGAGRADASAYAVVGGRLVVLRPGEVPGLEETTSRWAKLWPTAGAAVAEILR